MLSNGFLNGIKLGPSSIYSGVIRSWLNIINSQPLKQRLGVTVNSNSDVAPSIIELFISCCPFAIFRSVISIIVNTFNSRFGEWLFSHVIEECFKGCIPSFTDLYSSATIIFEGQMIRVIASAFHTNPCPIFFRFIHSMFGIRFAGDFSKKASTTSDMPIIEMVDYCLGCIPTITPAEPISTTMRLVRNFNGNKPTISFSNNVLKLSHRNDRPYFLVKCQRDSLCGIAFTERTCPKSRYLPSLSGWASKLCAQLRRVTNARTACLASGTSLALGSCQ